MPFALLCVRWALEAVLTVSPGLLHGLHRRTGYAGAGRVGWSNVNTAPQSGHVVFHVVRNARLPFVRGCDFSATLMNSWSSIVKLVNVLDNQRDIRPF